MGITEQNIQVLLNQTNTIVQKYNEIADISGERFNVFSILGLQSSETRLHSKLINELLNPKGKHGQKDLFLKLFIEVVNEKIEDKAASNDLIIDVSTKNISSQKIDGFKTETAMSKTEVSAGYKINNETNEGGRIDVLIKDNQGHGIIVENKIWAGDQPYQLLRYHKFGEKSFEKFHLIYLTVGGGEPSEDSIGKEELTKQGYICLSYREDIIKWLELCRKECVQLPIIRETLTQYINQLKIYSGQSIHHKMKDEIFKAILASDENFESAIEISKNFAILKSTYMEKLKSELKVLARKVVQEKPDYSYNSKKEFFEGKQYEGGLILYKESWKEKNMIIKFSFDQNNYNELKYGFVRESPSKNNGLIEDIYRNKLREAQLLTGGSKTNDFCPLYFEFDPNNWGNNKEAWTEIKNGTMIKKFEKAIYRLLEIADELQL